MERGERERRWRGDDNGIAEAWKEEERERRRGMVFLRLGFWFLKRVLRELKTAAAIGEGEGEGERKHPPRFGCAEHGLNSWFRSRPQSQSRSGEKPI